MEPLDPKNLDIHPDPILPSTWNQLFQVEGDEKNSTSPGVVNLAVGNDGTLYANSPNTPPSPVVLPRTSVEGAEWVFSGVFSVTDADTIAWGSGTLTTEDGHTYSIGAGNTGNMAAKTYIYFDVDVSETAFQTTTTAGNAVGSGKILIAIAQNTTGEAKFMALNDNQYNLDAANIVANSITANELAASITYAGSIIIDSAGLIRSGQTAYNTGVGWWIGNDGGTPKLSIGNPDADYFTFDGVNVDGSGSIKTSFSAPTYREFDASTTPIPLYIGTTGHAQLADADVAEDSHFIGFTENEVTDILPAVLNTNNTIDSGESLTCNAGDDRLLIVQVAYRDLVEANLVLPTAVTWGATSLTNIDGDEQAAGAQGRGFSVWYAVIGSNASNQSQTLTITGDTFSTRTIICSVFKNVNQATPFGNVGANSLGSSTAPSSTITTTIPSSLTLLLIDTTSETVSSYGDGLAAVVARTGTGTNQVLSSVQWNTIGSNAFNATMTGSAGWFAMALELIGMTATIKIRVAGVQEGFTGLTIGSTYFVSNTEGVIATSAGATAVLVGKAISATELLIIQSNP